jgi:DNA polymerase-1
MLGLCGDTADNIPGVPGIGPKTAEKLLAQYDTVEGLLDHVDELKGKQKEKVRDNADQARMSKVLATIQLDVPIEANWEAILLEKPDQTKLVPLLAEFEFRTLGKRIFGADFSAQEAATELVLMSEDDEKMSTPSSSLAASSPQLDLLPDIAFRKLADVKTDYRIVKSNTELAELVTTLTAAKPSPSTPRLQRSTPVRQNSSASPSPPKPTTVTGCPPPRNPLRHFAPSLATSH